MKTSLTIEWPYFPGESETAETIQGWVGKMRSTADEVLCVKAALHLYPAGWRSYTSGFRTVEEIDNASDASIRILYHLETADLATKLDISSLTFDLRCLEDESEFIVLKGLACLAIIFGETSGYYEPCRNRPDDTTWTLAGLIHYILSESPDTFEKLAVIPLSQKLHLFRAVGSIHERTFCPTSCRDSLARLRWITQVALSALQRSSHGDEDKFPADRRRRRPPERLGSCVHSGRLKGILHIAKKREIDQSRYVTIMMEEWDPPIVDQIRDLIHFSSNEALALVDVLLFLGCVDWSSSNCILGIDKVLPLLSHPDKGVAYAALRLVFSLRQGIEPDQEIQLSRSMLVLVTNGISLQSHPEKVEYAALFAWLSDGETPAICYLKLLASLSGYANGKNIIWEAGHCVKALETIEYLVKTNHWEVNTARQAGQYLAHMLACQYSMSPLDGSSNKFTLIPRIFAALQTCGYIQDQNWLRSNYVPTEWTTGWINELNQVILTMSSFIECYMVNASEIISPSFELLELIEAGRKLITNLSIHLAQIKEKYSILVYLGVYDWTGTKLEEQRQQVHEDALPKFGAILDTLKKHLGANARVVDSR
ncbi:hypothetical protein M422DRAFT_51033 [Sphaerobolus stellatus SS14]|uniref:Unplaced genomic scaffold SPHSTscaffold_102, whole genome shotgun sequence n=1 Tax=Sphaerobolus stellatus (strain SS14) TaxID=990650 RepID=A0A0C9U1A6_SPHS4|nr:hypothetical protein M422DRAFT_51033 [Sphaerobolus stellatus SS14]